MRPAGRYFGSFDKRRVLVVRLVCDRVAEAFGLPPRATLRDEVDWSHSQSAGPSYMIEYSRTVILDG